MASVELLDYGWHVNAQKPMCNDLAGAQQMLDAAKTNDRVLRVMENYLFYEPLRKLKAIVEAGEIGEVSGYHMKMVGTGNGGWDVPFSSFEWQMEQMKLGRGIMVFDDGWHKLSTALWLFGPIREVRAWIGNTHFGPGVDVDAPTMIAWEHENGIRGGWDVTLGGGHVPALGLLHQRRALGGNRPAGLCAGQSLHRARYPAAQPRGLPSTARCADITHSMTTGGAASEIRAATGCAGCATGDGPLLWSADEAVDVLRFALAAYESSAAGGKGVDPNTVL